LTDGIDGGAIISLAGLIWLAIPYVYATKNIPIF